MRLPRPSRAWGCAAILSALPSSSPRPRSPGPGGQIDGQNKESHNKSAHLSAQGKLSGKAGFKGKTHIGKQELHGMQHQHGVQKVRQAGRKHDSRFLPAHFSDGKEKAACQKAEEHPRSHAEQKAGYGGTAEKRRKYQIRMGCGRYRCLPQACQPEHAAEEQTLRRAEQHRAHENRKGHERQGNRRNNDVAEGGKGQHQFHCRENGQHGDIER